MISPFLPQIPWGKCLLMKWWLRVCWIPTQFIVVFCHPVVGRAEVKKAIHTVDGSEILHQLIGSSSHDLQCFIHPGWLALGFQPSTVAWKFPLGELRRLGAFDLHHHGLQATCAGSSGVFVSFKRKKKLQIATKKYCWWKKSCTTWDV